MAKGFLSLVVIRDWVSRAVLARRLSNTLLPKVVVENGPMVPVETSLREARVDGRITRRHRDRVWPWCTGVPSTSMPTVAEATAGIGAWLSLCNEEWQQQGMLEADPEEVGSMS
jgi:hypothetical protein